MEKINKTIDETRVFLDIPIGSKDQVDNLWVLRSGPLSSIDNFQARSDSFKEDGEKQIDCNNEIRPSEVENSWPSDFKEESPMISAIRDGFALWGRKMRIFLDVVKKERKLWKYYARKFRILLEIIRKLSEKRTWKRLTK